MKKFFALNSFNRHFWKFQVFLKKSINRNIKSFNYSKISFFCFTFCKKFKKFSCKNFICQSKNTRHAASPTVIIFNHQVHQHHFFLSDRKSRKTTKRYEDVRKEKTTHEITIFYFTLHCLSWLLITNTAHPLFLYTPRHNLLMY